MEIIDFDILGAIDENGQIKQYSNSDALRNSIVCWLTSFRNDILRSPNRGGYLTQHLYKPMSQSQQRSIYDSLIDGFNQDYFPYVKLLTLDIIPDYTAKTWKINIDVYSDLIKNNVQVSQTVKNFV